MSIMRPIRSIATALLVAGIAVAGCGRSQPDQSGTAASRPSAASTPSVTAPPATRAPAPGDATDSDAVVLADGRHPAYLKTIDPSRRTITFDLIQWYFGDDATREAAKDHQESPPPNDYYIRNVNPKLRTLPVQSGATITVNTLGAAWTGGATKDVPVTLAKLATLTRGYSPPFWITVRHDQVVKIAEQYVP
ncbi:MAG TPA: hypothetical protein VFA46_11185 [Actinomycetes bacterium]|jgi:hypothetical protein|nr:hypothetical protein [Actinomycetes bacterium]